MKAQKQKRLNAKEEREMNAKMEREGKFYADLVKMHEKDSKPRTPWEYKQMKRFYGDKWHKTFAEAREF